MDFTSEIFTRARKLNIYLVPQYLWLTLLYYLMINTFYELLNKFKENNPEITFDFPQKVLLLNENIMNTINEWSVFLLFFSITLIFSGISIVFIYYLPVIRNYDFAIRGGIGIYLGLWLLLITVTYYLFDFLGGFFVFVIPICAAIISYWENDLKYRLID